MADSKAQTVEDSISLRAGLGFSALAVATFQLAYSFPACSFLIAVYLWSLFQLTRLKTPRQASCFGLLVGMLAYGPQLNFFWTIFGPAAVTLWIVLAFWILMFLILGRSCRVHFGKLQATLLIPFLWTGLEYFRSELYYLRFSWLNAGYVFSNNLTWLPLNVIGMYGMGFLLMAAIGGCAMLRAGQRLPATVIIFASLAMITNAPRINSPSIMDSPGGLQIAGVQMEFPSESEVIVNLNKLVKAHPQAELLVLSEYTFDGPVPEKIVAWCRYNHRYLVAGGKDPASDSQYYNTIFVIAPSGEIIFKQGKCVPIQFFKDGLPAREQKLWDSPWGKIGFCVCYDLSYSRVTDQLIRLGAQTIIVPTMDVVDWGRHQHELHARVAPVRSAEYGVPVFRLASSGISQCVDATGCVLATAPMPGDAAMICGTLHLGKPGSLPWDRVLAPISAGVTCLTTAWFLGICFWRRKNP